jgi:hypothetical protein
MSFLHKIVIQARKGDGPWHTRSLLKELNHQLLAEKISEQAVIDEANRIIQKWHQSHAEDVQFRVNISRPPVTRRMKSTDPY